MREYYIYLIILHGILANISAFSLDKEFPLRLIVDQEETIKFKYNGSNDGLEVISENQFVAKVEYFELGLAGEGRFTVKAQFLGKTSLNIYENGRRLEENFEIIVTREERLIDKMFKYSVAALMSVMFINFGSCLDLTMTREIIVKPFGPILGFVSQFLFMPIMSFLIGKWLFPDDCELQLGTFFTGISPGGGGSNMWTVILGGNINLSVTMTTISTFSAFFMMPLWIFTLGKQIFDCANLGLPYKKLVFMSLGLIVPLGIGIIIQKKLPSLAKVLVRVLKPLSIILIFFIVIFAIITNLYIFKLFHWKIVVAGLGLPWSGFLFGYLLAKLFKQPYSDVLAISIETGIQNTGIAIFLLKFALDQPAADMTTIIPISNATMTPIPLLVLATIQKIKMLTMKKEPIQEMHQIQGDIEERPIKKDLSYS